jgi:hypothetical protein
MVARYAARVGVAAVVLGLSLAVPQSVAVSFADGTGGTDGASNSGSAGPSATSQQRTARTPRPPSARGAAQDSDTGRPPAATLPVPARGELTAEPPTTARPVRDAQAQNPAPDIDPDPLADWPVAPQTSALPAAAAPELPSVTVAQPDPVVPVITTAARQRSAEDPAPAPVAAPLAVSTTAEPPAARAVPVPTGLAAVSTPAGAAATSSFTDFVNGLLAPVQSLVEGAALLVRRSLFNEAPSVSAVRGTVTVGEDGKRTATDLSRPAAATANVAVIQSATATPRLQFQFVYGAGSELISAQARAGLESAAARLASYIVVSSPVVITYAVTARNSPSSSTLASASSSFISPGAGFMKTVVQNKIQTGVDANGSAADGSIDVNVGKPWAYGDTVEITQYDFQSTAMHELLHTLGFISFIGAPNTNTGKIWTVYDSYVVNSARKKVISSTYSWNTVYNTNLTGGSGGLFFGGPNALSANNGIVSLYTPSTWRSGSSLSHLNDSVFFGTRRALMRATVSKGPNLRTLSPVELGILKDIGYQVSNGSGTSALMVFGLFVTVRMRRRD